MLLIDLNGKWQVKRSDEPKWFEAVVPGSVYNDLLQAGLMKDPFYRDNELSAFEFSNYDYEYKKSFIATKSDIAKDQVVLLCEGLDTLCEIFLNDFPLFRASNMHRTYELDVKQLLVEGENSLRLVFKSPVQYVLSKQKESPLENVREAVEGISHLRKAHCMFGWDWGPKLPDMGIWRSISIRGYDCGRIDDVYITQRHEPSKVQLDFRIRLQKWNHTNLDLGVRIKTPTGLILEEKLCAAQEEEHLSVAIENPELWWPNNLGAQPLYGVEVFITDKSAILDSRSLKLGLRRLTVSQEKDQWGESFAFQINGVNLFAMGADYIPEDNILARCNKQKTEKLIKGCVDANFNSIRVWGGAYYPEDYFYDLCDEYGLIVWQDLMFACGVYEMSEGFSENIKHEVIDNMKRLRHHASLGIWCGNNEQELGWLEWGWSERCSPKLKADYIKQFEVLLPGIAQEIDPNTFYWLASPSSTGSFDKPNDESYGDMHYWGVWHGREPFTSYRQIFPRFMSEFGLQSFPSLTTVETFTEGKDRNIFSYVMESHQKSGTGNEKILYYIGETYQYPKDFDSLLYASQLIQAEGLRYGVEHWRRNRGRCMGAIYWQLNDCWPVASWSSIDYYGRWKALHYAAKRFFAPLLISACEEGTSVSLHVSNESVNKVKGTLAWSLMNASSDIVAHSEKSVEINALHSSECEALDFREILDTIEKQRNHYLEFKLILDGCIVSSGTVLFVKPKHFDFLAPKIEASITEVQDQFILELRSKNFARFVELSLIDADTIFSDNYFDLSANTVKTVHINKEYLCTPLSIDELKQRLKVRSLYDTYENR